MKQSSVLADYTAAGPGVLSLKVSSSYILRNFITVLMTYTLPFDFMSVIGWRS